MINVKPYYLFLLAVIIFIGLCFFASNESTLDINVHDTYYIIAHSHLYISLAVILFTVFTFYWSIDNAKIKLIAFLSDIHIYGTLITIIGMFFPYRLIFKPSNLQLYDDMQYVNICLTIAGLLFLFLQFVFIINIFVSITKKLCNSATE